MVPSGSGTPGKVCGPGRGEGAGSKGLGGAYCRQYPHGFPTGTLAGQGDVYRFPGT